MGPILVNLGGYLYVVKISNMPLLIGELSIAGISHWENDKEATELRLGFVCPGFVFISINWSRCLLFLCCSTSSMRSKYCTFSPLTFDMDNDFINSKQSFTCMSKIFNTGNL